MNRERNPCVYLLANGPRGTMYVGVTSNLPARIWQHRHEASDGFSRRYHVHDLVWYEPHQSMMSAIAREKAIKAWKRLWKIKLVEAENPQWRDLYPDIL